MTMITVMQIGALTFMTLLPVALSVILYMACLLYTSDAADE